jgi:hypothetical protein
MEVSTLLSHLALPSQSHLDTLFHLFAYLEKKHNAQFVYDPTYPDIDLRVFKQCDWKQFYGEVKEAIPPNARPLRGNDVEPCMFIDSDHAGDKLMQQSRMGFLIYLNMARIVWHLKMTILE